LSARYSAPEFALLCDAEGRVRRVLRDDFGLGEAMPEGRPLLDAVEPDSRDKARNLFAALRTERAALDWLLHLSHPGRDKPLGLQMAAVAVADGYLLAGCESFAGAARLLGDLALDHAADRASLGAALGIWSRWAAERGRQDADLLDELSRVNNELITAHRELAKRNAELAHLNTEKNQFIGMAAHDLRNPLSIILAYSEFLRGKRGIATDPAKRQFIDAIRRSSEFMLEIIDDLLNVTRIEAGKLVLNRVPTDLDQLVRENVALNGALAQGKGLHLAYQAEDKFPKLMLDPWKIVQVLNNLIGNAIKASPPGSTVMVGLARDDKGAVVRVTDEGPGIPIDELDAIFRPYQQGSLGTVSGGKSAGLGLAIAQRIVAGHGGRLRVESYPPDGTSFFVHLPQTLAGDPEMPAQTS
jgi:two-component system, OmpR family, sensor kinase